MSATRIARFQTAADLDPALAASFLQFSLALADTKHRLGVRLSAWVNGAPALEAAVAVTAMTQDELGHARSLFTMLRDLPGAPPELISDTDMSRASHFNPTFLDAPWLSWLDVIAANVLLDRALNVVFEAAQASQFGPLSGRVGKILQEERFHGVFGESWLARLAGTGGTARQRLQTAVDRVWPVAAAWFGPPDDAGIAALVEAGILASRSTELRQTWLERVTAPLQEHHLTTPEVSFDWSKWNPARREITHA